VHVDAHLGDLELFELLLLAGELAGDAQVEGFEKGHAHLFHGVLGPVVVPVDGGAVDDGRVEAAALAELGADWAHGQHQVQVGLYTLK